MQSCIDALRFVAQCTPRRVRELATCGCFDTGELKMIATLRKILTSIYFSLALAFVAGAISLWCFYYSVLRDRPIALVYTVLYVSTAYSCGRMVVYRERSQRSRERRLSVHYHLQTAQALFLSGNRELASHEFNKAIEAALL